MGNLVQPHSFQTTDRRISSGHLKSGLERYLGFYLFIILFIFWGKSKRPQYEVFFGFNANFLAQPLAFLCLSFIAPTGPLCRISACQRSGPGPHGPAGLRGTEHCRLSPLTSTPDASQRHVLLGLTHRQIRCAIGNPMECRCCSCLLAKIIGDLSHSGCSGHSLASFPNP